jgi:hypothetical protein
MAPIYPLNRREPDLERGAGRPMLAMFAAGVVLAATVAATALTLPRPLVLPVFSVMALSVAGVIAIMAWRRSTAGDQSRVTYWDVAGALAFFGVCAAMLSDAEQVMPIFEGAKRQP